MKYFLILFFISFSVFSQSDSSYYGEKISSTDLQQLSNIDFNNTSVQTKLEGEIISTCPKKGCWIEMKIDDKDVFVTLMLAYKNKEMENQVMQMIAGRLDNEQIASLALYFHQIK